MEQVLRFLDSISELEPGLRSFLKENLRQVTAQKDAILLKEGAIAEYISFIEKGLVRGFRSGVKDTERTIWFMKENDVFISIRSFLKQIPATETIQALEPCIYYRLAYPFYKQALAKYRSFNFHRAELLEKYYLLSEEREYMRQQQSRFARFCFLMEHYPELTSRVTDKLLASFIDVRPNYFSSLKNKYLKEKMIKK